MSPNAVVEIARPSGPAYQVGNDKLLTIIAGPCQLESREHGLEVSAALKEIADRVGLNLDLQDQLRQSQPHKPLGQARPGA